MVADERFGDVVYLSYDDDGRLHVSVNGPRGARKAYLHLSDEQTNLVEQFVGGRGKK